MVRHPQLVRPGELEGFRRTLEHATARAHTAPVAIYTDCVEIRNLTDADLQRWSEEAQQASSQKGIKEVQAEIADIQKALKTKRESHANIVGAFHGGEVDAATRKLLVSRVKLTPNSIVLNPVQGEPNGSSETRLVLDTRQTRPQCEAR
jgi:hypothetical protein